MRTFRISGRVIDRKTERGIKGLRVEAWDKDLILEDLVGTAVTDEHGAFQMKFDESYFKELFLDRRPDLFFNVFRGDKLIKSTEDSVLWNVEHEDIDLVIEVDESEVEIAQKLDGCLRRLLRMTDEEIIMAVEVEEAHLAERMQQIERLADILPPTATDEDRQAVHRIQELQRNRLLPHPIFGQLIIDKFKLKPVKMRAIVQFTGNRDDIIALGLEVRTQAQDIFTVVGTTKQLADLAAQPATLRMGLPVRLLPGVDEAAKQAEIYTVHTKRSENPMGYKGDDVIIGIIDSPLDVNHHAFRDPNPSGSHGTRVLYYWVQNPDDANAPGQSPHKFHETHKDSPDFSNLTDGRIYTKADINKAIASTKGVYGLGKDQICCTPKAVEHGTMVAGIATGSGHEANWKTTPKFIGAAPRADIVHVASDGYDFDIIAALDFIFAVAEKEDKPAVINISLGGHYGPHLGTDFLDEGIDKRLNSFDERVVVGITQNWNDEDSFRNGTFNPGSVEQITVTPKTSSFGFFLYYFGQEVEFQVSIKKDSSGKWQTAGKGFKGKLSGCDVSIIGHILTGTEMRSLWISASNAKSYTPINIKLRSKSKVTYYAWISPGPDSATVSGASYNKWTLCSIGCCKSMLTVGATDKLTKPDPNKSEPIIKFSGAGPTLDGRIKPEIVAVGSLVVAPDSDQKQNSAYIGGFGTSFAAPLVAGSAALLFQEARVPKLNYTLNNDTIKALLTQNAKVNHSVDDLNRYGYGRLRMIAPIDHIRGSVDVDVWVRTADDDYGEEPFPGGCFCCAPDIKVFEKGKNKEIKKLTWGTSYDVNITVRNLGNDDAVGTTVRLKYALPETAPTKWHPAVAERKVDVPALGMKEVKFKWIPKRLKKATSGETHFCLLAEVFHDKDKLNYKEQTADAWAMNIKSTNNIALRNVIIL